MSLFTSNMCPLSGICVHILPKPSKQTKTRKTLRWRSIQNSEGSLPTNECEIRHRSAKTVGCSGWLRVFAKLKANTMQSDSNHKEPYCAQVGIKFVRMFHIQVVDNFIANKTITMRRANSNLEFCNLFRNWVHFIE